MLELGMRLIYLSWRSFDREKQMLQKPRRQLIYQLVIKKAGLGLNFAAEGRFKAGEAASILGTTSAVMVAKD